MKKIKYAKTDFKYEMLPQNRRAVFKDVYKNRFPLIFRGGVALLLSCLPTLIFSLVMDFVRLSIYATYEEDAEALGSTLQLHETFTLAGFMILFFVILISLGGVLRIYRQLVWGEGIYFHNDWKIGLKQSYGAMAIATTIFGILFIISEGIFNLFIANALAWVPFILFLLVLLPIFIWMLLLINTYSGSFIECLKNGVFLYVKSFGITFLLTIATILPFGLYLITDQTFLSVKYVAIAVLILFYYPMLILVWILYSNKQFDKYINQQYYPEYYRKGLFNPEKK